MKKLFHRALCVLLFGFLATDLVSLVLQSQRRGWVYRFALTENLQNFSNTPDVGLTFSVARVMLGR